MERAILTISVSSLWPFERSAQFFGPLIEPTDSRNREQLVRAFYHRQLRHNAQCDPQWAKTWQYWPPEYLLFDTKLADRLHRRAMRILDQERMLAAELAHAFIFDAVAKANGRDGIELWEDGENIGRPLMENFGLWALRQQRRLAGRADDPNKVTWETFQQRAWRETKPVLHLALAYLLEVRGKPTPAREAATRALFEDPHQTRKLLSCAEDLRQILLRVAQSGSFRLSEEETVQVVAG
jgi:hypothetical protein